MIGSCIHGLCPVNKSKYDKCEAICGGSCEGYSGVIIPLVT